MSNVVFFSFLIFGSFFAVLMAVLNYKKRARKVVEIEEKCSRIISLANHISGQQENYRETRRENAIIFYEYENFDFLPFKLDEIFANYSYNKVIYDRVACRPTLALYPYNTPLEQSLCRGKRSQRKSQPTNILKYATVI